MENNLNSEILTLLEGIQNPETKKTMLQEKRFVMAIESSRGVEIKYNRDGISTLQKKHIEGEVVKALGPKFSPDKIFIMSISSESKVEGPAPKNEVNQAVSGAAEAQLKVGHGQVGNKKAVPMVKKVIAVASGKGGVGKSTFTVNLALSLKNLGYSVGILDADIYGPSIPMLLNKRAEKPVVNDKRKIMPIDAFGVSFISFGLFIGEGDPVIWRGPMLGGVLNQFFFDVDWSVDGKERDVLIIDLPPGTGDIQLSMVQNANVDGAVIISTPQDVALLDAIKGLQMFNKVNLPIVGMVENMSSFICHNCGTEHHIFGHGGAEEAVQKLNVDFLGRIPLELDLRLGSDSGNPYMGNQQFEGREVWKAYQAIAHNVARKLFNHEGPIKTDKENKPGFFSKIFK